MVFNKNVDVAKQNAIMDLWSTSQIQQYEKYLGLPSMVGKSKIGALGEIKYKVWLKLQGWKGNMFSQGGREILLKAVALAIP